MAHDFSKTAPLVISLMGPTASGKTLLALDLAKRLDAEIISVDSAMVYRGMDIGTAKPEASVRKEIPHHLIDILDPSESFSAGEFRQKALQLITEIHARGKVAILVGGTMLYFRTLWFGFSKLPPANKEVRQKLLEEIKYHGLSMLWERLKIIDAEAARRISANDPQRILRALEVYELTGIPLTQLQKQNKYSCEFPFRLIELALGNIGRSLLHARIKTRMEQMLARGLVEEVERLYRRGDLHLDLPSMRSVGYRQVWLYLEGNYDFATLNERLFIATRQLAKRQLTWLRSWPGIKWIDGSSVDDLIIKTVA